MEPAPARGGSVSLRGFALLVGGLLATYLLIPFVIRGFRFPVGPDASVYLWWMGLAGHDGLSVLGNRAGVPVAAIVLSRGLNVSPVTALAGFQSAIGVAIGLVAAALVETSERSRRATVICGYLTGAFGLYVAGGYFSTLGFVAVYLGAVGALTLATWRGAILAAALLGAGGLTHPELAVLGAIVLVSAAAIALRSGERLEAARVGLAALGGAAVSASLGLALLAGPAAPRADTSRDTFLIRAGLSDVLEDLYARRILLHVWGYVPYVSVPLAVAGLPLVSGLLRKILLAWSGVTIAAIVLGALTGWFPPERALSAALVLPILAGLGIERLLARGTRISTVVAVVGFAAIVAGAGWTWWHTAPPVYEVEAARANEAARYAAAAPDGTPLVFQVTGPQPVLTFFATRSANEIRAAMPPDRIRDVYVVVPEPAADADEERRRLWATYEDDVRRASVRSGLAPIVFRLTPFIRDTFPVPTGGLPREVSRGVRIFGLVPAPRDDIGTRLSPTSPAAVVVSTLAILLLLGVTGVGWVRAVTTDIRLTVGWAPSVGLAALVLAAVALERSGLSISHPGGAWIVVGAAAVPGWVISVMHPARTTPEG